MRLLDNKKHVPQCHVNISTTLCTLSYCDNVIGLANVYPLKNVSYLFLGELLHCSTTSVMF